MQGASPWKKEKKKGWGKKERKMKHSGNSSHSPSEFSDSKEKATLGAYLTLAWPKRRKERRNLKKKKKRGEQREIEMKHYFKGKYGSPVCLNKDVPPKVSLPDNVWGNTVLMGLGVRLSWGLWDAGILEASGSWEVWAPYIGCSVSSARPPLGVPPP